ncbi:MAG: hypothetical protein HN337_03495 [Deltaproteobacteria bacterium]|jgi:hypothetical protein|nr:hypothetical protein [Deltaproteobacteria bacterium]
MKSENRDLINLQAALQDWDTAFIAKCTNRSLIYRLEIRTNPPSYARYLKSESAPVEEKAFPSMEDCLEAVKQMTKGEFLWWTPSSTVKTYKVELVEQPDSTFIWEDHEEEVFNSLDYISTGGHSQRAFDDIKILDFQMGKAHFLLQVAEPNNVWHRPFSRYLVQQGDMEKYRSKKNPQRLLNFEEV